MENMHMMGEDNPNPKKLKEGLKTLEKYTTKTFSSRLPINDQDITGVSSVQRGNNHKYEKSIVKKDK